MYSSSSSQTLQVLENTAPGFVFLGGYIYIYVYIGSYRGYLGFGD